MLRASAATSSKLLLFQLGYMSRMSDIPWSTKHQFMQEIEENLSLNQVPEDQVQTMREPLLRFLTIDLLAIPFQILTSRVARLRNEIQAEIAAAFPSGINMTDPRYIKLDASWRALRQPSDRFATGRRRGEAGSSCMLASPSPS